MPKRRRNKTARHNKTARRPHSLVGEPAAGLLAEFDQWLGPGDFQDVVSSLAELYLEVKSSALGRPDPTLWTGQDVLDVVTDIVPSKALLDDALTAALAPAAEAWLRFLHESGHSSPRSIRPERIPALMQVVQARLTERAMEESDLDDLDDLPDLSSLGPLPWPEFLGPAPDPDKYDDDVSPEEIEEFLASSRLLARADAVMAWLGDRRPVTSTGALRVADTRELLDTLGLTAPADLRSMWDVTPLALLWHGLTESGIVEVARTFARPGSAVIAWPPPGATTDERLVGARLLAALVIHGRLGGDSSTDVYPPLLSLLGLLKSAEPDGFTVPKASVENSFNELARLQLLADLTALQETGVLERDGSTFHLPRPLVPALAVATGLITGEPVKEMVSDG